MTCRLNFWADDKIVGPFSRLPEFRVWIVDPSIPEFPTVFYYQKISQAHSLLSSGHLRNCLVYIFRRSTNGWISL